MTLLCLYSCSSPATINEPDNNYNTSFKTYKYYVNDSDWVIDTTVYIVKEQHDTFITYDTTYSYNINHTRVIDTVTAYWLNDNGDTIGSYQKYVWINVYDTIDTIYKIKKVVNYYMYNDTLYQYKTALKGTDFIVNDTFYNITYLVDIYEIENNKNKFLTRAYIVEADKKIDIVYCVPYHSTGRQKYQYFYISYINNNITFWCYGKPKLYVTVAHHL